jgi:NADH:ubiquinone oxidoreductase subunit 2 (subunit N)
MVAGDQVLAVPSFQLDAWRAELVLAVTVLAGLALARAGRHPARLVVLAGLALATGLAVVSMPADAIRSLGPHLLVDPPAAVLRAVVTSLALLVALCLPARDARLPASLALGTLGCVLIAQAVTLGSLLASLAMILVGNGLAAAHATDADGRPAVARWLAAASLGWALVAFGGTLWCGLTGSLDLVAGPAVLADRPALPGTALPLLLSLVGVGLGLAVLGEPGRFRRDEQPVIPPVLTGWLTLVPLAGLVPMLQRVLAGVTPIPARPLLPVPDVVVLLAGLLTVVGFLAALSHGRLERRLSWAASGLAGLALLSLAGTSPDTRHLALGLVLAAAPAHVAALALVDPAVGPTWRRPRLLLLVGLLVALAALPPLAGWRPRLDLLAFFLETDQYRALGLATAGTLLGALAYLPPAVAGWRDAGTGERTVDGATSGWALLLSAVVLAALAAWGFGLIDPLALVA